MSWQKIPFNSLFKEPSRNGIYKTAEFHGRGVKIVNMGELFSNDRISNQKMERVEISESEKRTVLLQEGDLLFARRSLVESGAGKVAIVDNLIEDTTFESSVIRIRLDKEKCLPLFYLYWFKSYNGRSVIYPLITGVNVKGIRGSELANVEVDFPPITTQKRVVDILSAYDSLIENNQKQIKLLEEAAQRLYKEWFVDLRFPGYEHTKIVNGVPEGWTIKTIDNLALVLTGKKDANFGTEDGLFPFFTCSKAPLKAPSYSFDEKAVILAGNGDFNVKLFRGKFEAYQRTYVIIPKEDELLYLIYHTIDSNMSKLVGGASGSTIKFLTKGMIDSLKIAIPDKVVLEDFLSFRETVQNKLELLHKQRACLFEARDRLLPKLMNGEITV